MACLMNLCAQFPNNWGKKPYVDEDLPVMTKLMRRGAGGFDLNRKLESQIGSKGLRTTTKCALRNDAAVFSNDTATTQFAFVTDRCIRNGN